MACQQMHYDFAYHKGEKMALEKGTDTSTRDHVKISTPIHIYWVDKAKYPGMCYNLNIIKNFIIESSFKYHVYS